VCIFAVQFNRINRKCVTMREKPFSMANKLFKNVNR
jgi:hypothetical protein